MKCSLYTQCSGIANSVTFCQVTFLSGFDSAVDHCEDVGINFSQLFFWHSSCEYLGVGKILICLDSNLKKSV